MSCPRSPFPRGRSLCLFTSAVRLLLSRRRPLPSPRRSGTLAICFASVGCGIPASRPWFLCLRLAPPLSRLPTWLLTAASILRPSCASVCPSSRPALLTSRRRSSVTSACRCRLARRRPWGRRLRLVLRCLRRSLLPLCLPPAPLGCSPRRLPWRCSLIWCDGRPLWFRRPVPFLWRRRLPRPRPRRRCSRRSDWGREPLWAYELDDVQRAQ